MPSDRARSAQRSWLAGNDLINMGSRIMFGLLKKLMGADAAPKLVELEAVEYNGYFIVPTPKKEPTGFRVQGRIEKRGEVATQIYEFVRADIYYSEDDTASVAVQKGQRLIEEQGERLFATETS